MFSDKSNAQHCQNNNNNNHHHHRNHRQQEHLQNVNLHNHQLPHSQSMHYHHQQTNFEQDPQQQQQQQPNYYNDSYAQEIPEMAQSDSNTSWLSTYIPSQVTHFTNSLPAIPHLSNLPIPSFFGASNTQDLSSRGHQQSMPEYGQQQQQQHSESSFHPNQFVPSQLTAAQEIYQQQQMHPPQPQQYQQQQQQQQEQQQQQPSSRFQLARSISDTSLAFFATPEEENPSATNSRRSIRRTLSNYLFTENQNSLPTTYAAQQQQQNQNHGTTAVETVTNAVGGLSRRVSSWAVHGKNATLRMAGYEVYPEQAMLESGSQWGSAQLQDFNGCYQAGFDVSNRRF
ncbi:hypothetical protein CcCBS67573_g01995 [Chytriomyces confervae]|uniref:Uncharacterized protein n=1 Tax=Chytriomyces confervae TaxID=246404 RepID=A0A507FK41_9FUNG|nr:hypothetical protein CcCBS67573_g01995 [Chytriomyces confervae]